MANHQARGTLGNRGGDTTRARAVIQAKRAATKAERLVELTAAVQEVTGRVTREILRKKEGEIDTKLIHSFAAIATVYLKCIEVGEHGERLAVVEGYIMEQRGNSRPGVVS